MSIPPEQVIDLVVAIEKDFSEFYMNLQSNENLEPMRKIFQFMSTHSELHAQMIANYRTNAKIPQLQSNPMTVLHHRLKTQLAKQLGESQTIDDAASKLAQAEEILAQAYAKIAAHYEDVSDRYRLIANKFNSLADDEYKHRDYIQRESKQIRLNVSGSEQKSNR